MSHLSSCQAERPSHFFTFHVSMPSKARQNGEKKEKGISPELINRADKIGCLCTNANSLERLFTLPESRSFDYPTAHHPFIRPTFLFTCLYYTSPSPLLQRSKLAACPAVLDLGDDDEATGGSLRMLHGDCWLPSGSKTKPHYHKELSLLVERVFTFFLICLIPPTHCTNTQSQPNLPPPLCVQYHCC